MPPRRKRGQVVSESQTSASGPGFEFFGKNKTVRAVYLNLNLNYVVSMSLFSYIIFTKSRSNIQYKKTFSNIVLKIINIPLHV